ncbi:MAG: hypothetical protein K1X71_06275 [Pirellulales bacterium]|nr:hypothetical protein [Pirellulales bacterium]
MPRRTQAAREAWLLGLLFFSLLAAAGCGRSTSGFDPASDAEPPESLTALGIFVGDGRSQQPAPGVIPYDINTPLFSDYATKYRFVKLPAGGKAQYNADRALDFPVGTIIAKTFAYPHDMRDPTQGERLMETRILLHRADGWVGLPYVWNDEQTEARLEVVGAVKPVKWIHTDGNERAIDYLIPNANQCKGCHKAERDTMLPIGPKARHMNRDLVYHDRDQPYTENQLTHWTRIGALEGAPADPAAAPRMAVWNDPSSGSLNDRARAWLEINCAHCHNPGGNARNSGLNLMASTERPFEFGVFKPPVAAGRGSGGLRYDIVPGKPDESVLVFRIGSDHPEVMMPEIGRRLVHQEGLALIREWVASLEAPAATSGAQ